MKQVLVVNGRVVVAEVPAPMVGPKNVLVRVAYSCVSPGTEMAGLRSSGQSLYRRVLKQPEKIRVAIDLVRDSGFAEVVRLARDVSSRALEVGYSAAGTIIAVGSDVDGLKVGDRVACGGAGLSNHAEIIDVPCNLAVTIPTGLRQDVASTVALGAIAMQGVRRASPTLGETIVVVGLGLLGQITTQLLKRSGCRVIGVDLDPERIRVALENGLDVGVDPSTSSYVVRTHDWTGGFGADAAIVTAAGGSHEIISEAMQACRRKGRVVLVGDVGLNLSRADFYQKELDFLISTSYGPGRYDPAYELGGHDYPLPYVRWTENRNMEEYLRLVAEGRVSLRNLPSLEFGIDDAPSAYEALKKSTHKPLLVFLAYQERPEATAHRLSLGHATSRTGVVRVALVGMGAFAKATHLPNLAQLRAQYQLRAIVDRSGVKARWETTDLGVDYVTTNYDDVLADPDIDLVLLATRHNLHAPMALRALQSGKHVFVEKPLATTLEQLQDIQGFFEKREQSPVLMTGFNRRFSPAMLTAKAALRQRSTPMIVNYRMNAGYIPLDSWVHSEQGGGRNIGEACHIYDLFCFLVDAEVTGVRVSSVRPRGGRWLENDNFVATVTFADGSVCALTYTAMGHPSHPKERMDVYCDGMIVSLDDYKSLTISGLRQPNWHARRSNKGHLEELKALASCLTGGGAWPISLDQQLQATAVSLDVEAQIMQGHAASSEVSAPETPVRPSASAART